MGECWGLEFKRGDQGRLLSGKPSSSDFVRVDVNSQAACAIRSSGEIHCWGNRDTWLEVSESPTGSDFENLSSAPHRTCAIRRSGSLECWGKWSSNTPLGEFVSVSLGEYYSCGIKVTGEIVCWDVGPITNTPQLTESGATWI